jgi:hypothetical protein
MLNPAGVSVEIASFLLYDTTFATSNLSSVFSYSYRHPTIIVGNPTKGTNFNDLVISTSALAIEYEPNSPPTDGKPTRNDIWSLKTSWLLDED